MSLLRPVETSWEMSNWKQVSMWIPDSSEISTQSSAGCVLLYSTGRQGQTAQATSGWWLLTEQVSSILQVRDTAVPNSHSLELFLSAQALNCILGPLGAQLSLIKMHFTAVPAGSWGRSGWGSTGEGISLHTNRAGARRSHWVKNCFVFENWLQSLLPVLPGSQCQQSNLKKAHWHHLPESVSPQAFTAGGLQSSQNKI